MGTLVFQATLGGAVNIIGPNIANTINFTLPSADGTSGQTWTTNGSGLLTFGTLGVAGGGTGLTTLATGSLSYGAGTSAFSALAIGTAGQILTVNSGATAPQWSTLTGVAVTTFSAGTTGFTPSSATAGAITLSGTLVAANGGTGQSSYAVGDLLYASTTTALSKLADVATGNALISGGVGVAPSWGKIGLTTHVSGTLPTANGGTNLTSFTSGGVVYASSTSALATGSALTWSGTSLGLTGTTSAITNVLTATTAAIYTQYSNSGNNFYVGKDGSVSAFGTTAYASILYEAGNNPMVFFTSATERMRIDYQGNVGIGTSSPANKLDVIGSANVNGSLTISPNTNLKNTFTFTTNASNDGRLFIKSDTTDKVDIQANGSSYFEGCTVRFISTISVGNSTPSSSGAGLTFPVTQSASSNANTLDDYEEGDWTASFVPNTSGTITLSSNTGTYTKVGRVVTISGNFIVSSVSSPTGYLKIAGLPFAGGSNAKFRCAIAIDGTNMNATMTTVLVASIQGDSNIYVFKPDGLGGQSLTTAADMKATTQIFIGGTYTID